MSDRCLPVYGFSLIWHSPKFDEVRKKCRYFRKTTNRCGRLGGGWQPPCDGFCNRMYRWEEDRAKEERELPSDPVKKEEWLRAALGLSAFADDFVRRYGIEQQRNKLYERDQRLARTLDDLCKYFNNKSK